MSLMRAIKILMKTSGVLQKEIVGLIMLRAGVYLSRGARGVFKPGYEEGI